MSFTLGEDETTGGLFVLEAAQLAVSVHVLGNPGMGKSVALGRFALASTANGEGVILLDIKDGQLARDVAARADPARLIYIAPGIMFNRGRAFGFNILEGAPDVVVDTVLDLFERTGEADLNFMSRIRKYLDLSLSLAVSQSYPTTLQDARDALMKPDKRRQMLESSRDRLSPGNLDRWQEFEAMGTLKGDVSKPQRDMIQTTVDRIDRFLTPHILAAMLTQPLSTINLAQELDAGKLLVFNLVDGDLTHRQSLMLGNVVMAMLVNAAMSRPTDPDNRVWRVIADEFDLLAAEAFTTSMEKLRAARIFPVMAHQHLDQLKTPQLRSSLKAAPVKIYCRISPDDERQLAGILGGPRRARELAKLPKHHAWVQVMDEDEVPAMWAHLAKPRDGQTWTSVALADWDEALTREEMLQRLREAVDASERATVSLAKAARMVDNGNHQPTQTPRQSPPPARPATPHPLRSDRASDPADEVFRRPLIRHPRST